MPHAIIPLKPPIIPRDFISWTATLNYALDIPKQPKLYLKTENLLKFQLKLIILIHICYPTSSHRLLP